MERDHPAAVPHLRMKVYTSLKCLATSLETVASPLAVLRMQVHFELAKCEEQSDFVVMARIESENALHCDYGSLGDPATTQSALTTEELAVVELDRRRNMDQIVAPFVQLLTLRSSVFESPSDAEGKALMWIQQARESKSQSFISDMLTKALYVMMDETRGRSRSRGDSLGGDGVTADLSLVLMAQGPLTIAPVPLEGIENVLKLPRSRTAVHEASADALCHHVFHRRVGARSEELPPRAAGGVFPVDASMGCARSAAIHSCGCASAGALSAC